MHLNVQYLSEQCRSCGKKGEQARTCVWRMEGGQTCKVDDDDDDDDSDCRCSQPTADANKQPPAALYCTSLTRKSDTPYMHSKR